MQSDPGERVNIIDDPAHTALVADLRCKMLKWLESTDDIVPYAADSRFTPEMLWARVRSLVPPEKAAEYAK